MTRASQAGLSLHTELRLLNTVQVTNCKKGKREREADMSRTSVFEQFHDCPVLAKGISRKSRVAQGRIEALDLDRILQRDRDTSQWSLQIDFSACPFLCFWKQQFRHTVRLLL